MTTKTKSYRAVQAVSPGKQKASEAYARLIAGKARFRMVLTMES